MPAAGARHNVSHYAGCNSGATSSEVQASITSPALRSAKPRDLNAALEVLSHFAHVVLEAPQRLDLAIEDHRGVTQHAHLGVAA